MNRRFFRLIAALALLALALPSYPQCSTCPDAQSLINPFQEDQRTMNPYTLGLPMSSPAPTIEGATFEDAPTLLVVVSYSCDPEYYRLMRVWSEIPGLHVVVALSGLSTTGSRVAKQAIGNRATVIEDPDALGTAASYRVGQRASPVTFLIGRDGVILLRWRGFANYRALDQGAMLRDFVETGELPEETIPQHVLWYGDLAPWPDLRFGLHDRHGELAKLPRDQPLLLLTGPALGLGSAAHADLAPLLAEYPEVAFVCLLSYKTEEELASIWKFGRLVGLDETRPEWYAIDLDAFMTKIDPEADRAALDRQAQELEAAGWQILFDPNRQLTHFWLLYAMPGVMLLDAGGSVSFPFTIYPVSTDADGHYISVEGAVDVLRATLDDMLG